MANHKHGTFLFSCLYTAHIVMLFCMSAGEKCIDIFLQYNGNVTCILVN